MPLTERMHGNGKTRAEAQRLAYDYQHRTRASLRDRYVDDTSCIQLKRLIKLCIKEPSVMY